MMTLLYPYKYFENLWLNKLSWMCLFLFLSLLILYGVQLLHNVEGGGFINNTTKLNSDQHSEPIKVEEIYSRYILILGAMTVIAAILVLFIEPKIQRKEALTRAGKTLKLVLNENRRELINKDRKFQIISRKITRENSNEKQEIYYVNINLDCDPYESILHPGFFTHFCPKTQNALSTLHHALEINNDLIRYIDHYTDLYNIFHHYNGLSDNDFHYQDRKTEYEYKVMELQKEILELIDSVEILIDEELEYNSIFTRDYCDKIHTSIMW
jgi:hypothetical protein